MPQVVGMAKKLVDKWSRMVYGICTTYGTRDDEYETEISSRDQYRKLRQKLSKIQKDAEQDESPSEDEAGADANNAESPCALASARMAAEALA